MTVRALVGQGGSGVQGSAPGEGESVACASEEIEGWVWPRLYEKSLRFVTSIAGLCSLLTPLLPPDRCACPTLASTLSCRMHLWLLTFMPEPWG